MYQLSARDLRDLFLKGEMTAQAIAEVFLKRIAKNDPRIGAFLTVLSERVIDKASLLDKKRASGKPLGQLAAIPIAIKDNIHIQGELSTCGSRFLSNYKAPFSATVTLLMEQEDALLIGKTNLDEFAMGSSTENSAYQLTKNPWDLACTPGGSSGGSAAAVSARLTPLALGSDTGGSVRQPASFTGIVGFKPTYGRVSRYGLVAFASSLDQIGPLATNVKDAALLMEVIGRHCPKDATSLDSPPIPYLQKLQNVEASIKNQKIGIPWHFLEHLSKEVLANFKQSIALLKDAGATIVDVDLDVLKVCIPVYYVLATAEASTNLARFDGIRYGLRSPHAVTLEEVYELSKQEGFGREVKNRILLGTYVLSAGYRDAYYKKAQQIRTLIIEKFNVAFSQCDVVALPTSPIPAFPLGSFQDPFQMYLQDIYTIPANIAGLPAISIPSGFSEEGKPFSLQFIGPQRHDAKLLAWAHAFEARTSYHEQIPPLFNDEALS
ncbi:MAG: Asp-tRNA(Asn)/Glu-tRNA(Gln) amidotransferase subunit GatA [Anaerolineae bacterium]